MVSKLPRFSHFNHPTSVNPRTHPEMKRNAPSPKPQGFSSHEPFELNPNVSILCPEAINFSAASSRSLIENINADNADRHLDHQSAGDQLDILRLEVLRLKLLKSQRPNSILGNEMPPYATPAPTQSSSSNGQPGPTVPNSMRTRASVLSESEISVLDIGPSLQFPDIPARRNSSAANPHDGIGLARTTSPSFALGLSSDTLDHPVERRLEVGELGSVTLTSDSTSSHNEFTRNLRQRRQNQPNITLASSQEPQPHYGNHSLTASGDHGLREGFDFGHNPTSFVDKANSWIFSLSAPQPPQSPTLPPLPILQRTQSSVAGINPALLTMHNTEQVGRNAHDAAGFQGADQT